MIAAANERQRARARTPDELGAWFAEFRRLVDEAENRFGDGEYRQVLASLAAIPGVHRLLVDGCGAMLDTTEVEGPADSGPLGLYL